MESIFPTILAGVLDFLIGQYFLKLVFEPLIALREALGRVSAFCLYHHGKITNGNGSQEMHDELKQIVASMIAKQNAIPLYVVTRWLLSGATREDILSGCRC